MTHEGYGEAARILVIGSEVQAILGKANARLRGLLANEALLRETPREATSDLEQAVETPPSVNSMLVRLEKRGFIRRTSHQARGIELAIDPDLIPPLDRPFRG